MDAIRAYARLGNARELSDRSRRAVVIVGGSEITPQDLDLTHEVLQSADSLDSFRIAHRRIEVELLLKAMSLHRGNLTRVARDLKVSRTTLYRKMRAYNLGRLIPSAIIPARQLLPKRAPS